MGGNALKNTTTRRYQADEYHALCRSVSHVLGAMFPRCPHEVIFAYRKKESFGDMDIVIQSDMLPMGWVDDVREYFRPNELIKNGNVVSFDCREFQIDLIATKSEDFETSQFYFAYNDLGNLMGRIAHKMGVKLGHDGLVYKFRDSKDHVFREIVISKDWPAILQFLGLSPTWYMEGFDSLQQIFEFVASSEFFNPDIYLLENRNNVSRVRDRKRKTYMEFLVWCETHKGALNRYQFPEDKTDWMHRLFEFFPPFSTMYQIAATDLLNHEAFKAKFNGGLVMEWTGLQGKELGDFVRWMHANVDNALISLNPEVLPSFTKYCHEVWTCDGRFTNGVKTK